MPLSAMIARQSLMDWERGAHASTFGGNPVSVAAALVTLDLLERSYMANASRMGGYIMSHTAGWPKRHRSVGDIRGRGLMIAIEFVRNQQTKEKAPELRDRIIQMAFQKGLLILGAGENSIRLAPPLMIDQEQAEFALATLDSCISTVEREARA